MKEIEVVDWQERADAREKRRKESACNPFFRPFTLEEFHGLSSSRKRKHSTTTTTTTTTTSSSSSSSYDDDDDETHAEKKQRRLH